MAMQNDNEQIIKGYIIRGLFGEGGFGKVYRAYQPTLQREVAIKVILPDYATDPDFIRRFEFEAQTIARLEHPHIVPLYDYWREANHAYLVMRALSGNLSEAAWRQTWTTAMIGRLLDQIAGALTIAHQNQIIHRDIKPDNILLDEQNNAYLADFGIASQIDVNSSEADGDHFGLGSIAYIAPEQLLRQPPTALADIFSLGIVLFQLLTGSLPFANERTISGLIDKQLEAIFPPLDTFRVDLSPALNAVIQRAVDKDPANRFPDALSLAAAYHKAVQGSRSRIAVGSAERPAYKPANPYKGLRAFQESDQATFFGRKTFSEKLLTPLRQAGHDGRFLSVIGPSGSGKSSVIRAGVLPQIRQNAIPDSGQWFIVDMLPGADPFVSLDAAIQRVAVNPPAGLIEQLHSDERSLSQIVRTVLPADPKIELLLVIDQFEELFTLVDDEAIRVKFLNNLVNAVLDPASRLRLIITLRADFVDRLLHYARFGQLIDKHHEFVLPLSAQELELAISGPAQQVGVEVQTELVAAIVSEVVEQPGALPLLQFALTELFEQQQGGILTLDAYRTSGGVLGSVARQAELLYNGLDAESQQIARQVLLRLVAPGEESEDTRRRVLRSELSALAVDQKLLNPLLAAFNARRLLTFDYETASRRPTVEVAHEALIRTWPRLRDWVNESRQEILIQRRLLAAASEWTNAKRDPSFLADGARLQQFEDWSTITTLAIGEDEAHYLRASIAQRTERQLIETNRKLREARTSRLATNFRRATIILLLVAVIAVAALIALLVEVRQADERVSQENALVSTAQTSLNALGLAAEANKILLSDSGNVEVAALLGIRALTYTYLPEADTALRQAVERDYTLKIYNDPPKAIYATAFSPDGKLAVSAGADNTARVWEVRTGQTLEVFTGHQDNIESVAFSPDGRYILTGSKDTTTRLWDVETGKTVRIFGHRVTPSFEPGPYSAVNVVAFSPDGRYVLTGSRETRVRLWDVQTGLTVRTFDNVNSGVFGVAFSPDGRTIAIGLRNSKLNLWDIQTGKMLQTLIGHTGAIWSVAYSPDGQYLLTGSGDGTARVWEVRTGQTLHILQGHLSDVTGVAFSPDSKLALTVSADGTGRLWNVETGERLREYTGHTDSVWGAAFSPDGQTVMTSSSDGTVRIWDANLKYSPFLFAMHNAGVQTVAFSHDGRYVLTGSDDQTVQLWDTRLRQRLATLTGFTNSVYRAVFSPDDSLILATGNSNVATLWDVRTRQKIGSFQTYSKDNLYSLGFSADGQLLFSGGDDGVVRLWDRKTLQLLATFSGHQGQVESVTISPDGTRLVSGSYDHTARIWDIQKQQLLFTLSGHTAAVHSVAYSPDGAYILTGSGDNTARLWDAKTGAWIRTFIGHTGEVTTVAFSSDGQRIVTGSTDATLMMWDVQTGQSLRTFAGHSKTVSSAAFSPDDKYILSGSTDGTVRLWEVDYRDFVAAACARLTSDFTDNQRLHFKIGDNKPTCPQFAQPSTLPTLSPSPTP